MLIVGAGPAGHARRRAARPSSRGSRPASSSAATGRLAIGQADGIQARSVETFQAFGFAERIIAEAYRITEMAFWKPDPEDPARIVRARARRRRPDRHQRVPAPHRQPGARARLLRRGRWRNAPDAHDARLRLRVPRPGGRTTRASTRSTVTLRAHARAPATGEERDRARQVRASAPTAPAAGCARRSAARIVGDQAEPRVGRHGRARRHRLPRHPHQVRDPVRRRRQHPADPARGRATCSACTSTSARSPRTTTAPCARRRSSRSSRKANEILHPYTLDVKQRRLAQRLRGRAPPHRPVRRRAARARSARARRASSSPATPATRTAPRPARA